MYISCPKARQCKTIPYSRGLESLGCRERFQGLEIEVPVRCSVGSRQDLGLRVWS